MIGRNKQIHHNIATLRLSFVAVSESGGTTDTGGRLFSVRHAKYRNMLNINVFAVIKGNRGVEKLSNTLWNTFKRSWDHQPVVLVQIFGQNASPQDFQHLQEKCVHKRSRWHSENGIQRKGYFVFVSEGVCFEEKSFCAVWTDGQTTIWGFCEPIIWCFTAVCLSKPLPSSWSPCAAFRLPKSLLLDENTPKCF